MWSRRGLLAAALALAACEYEPVLDPGDPPGVGVPIALAAPAGELQFFYRERLADRLGDAETADLTLTYSVETSVIQEAISPDRVTERFLINGLARWTLATTFEEVASGDVTGSASYSNTGTTVSAAAAQRDAQRRLMVILADRTVSQIVAKLPPGPGGPPDGERPIGEGVTP